jgi:hypothetical protein
MRYQEIIKTKQRAIRVLWSLTILLLGLALSGWLSPIGAQVTLCGEDISREDGFYRLRGHLTCSTDPILYIDEENAEFDLRGFTATGNTSNTGIRMEADNVIIVGGKFKKCETALRVEADGCEIEHFKAIDSSDKAIRIRGDGNSIVKSLCLKAGNDCFELRGDGPEGNAAEWCTAIKSGGQGIQFRGPGYAYKCSVFGGSGEGFQIQEDVSDVMIKRCLAFNNAKGGIEIKAGATENSIKRNILFANGDGIEFFDLIDENENCDLNTWKRNKFRSSNQPCIK